jgi:transcriptional regulator with XRE-family HTH domain
MRLIIARQRSEVAYTPHLSHAVRLIPELDEFVSDPPTAEDDVQRATEILARNVQSARRARGLTQEELGERSGLARAKIHRIEKAAAPDNNPTMKTLISLANGLGLNAAQAYRLLLPEGVGEPESTTPPDLGQRMPIQDGTLAIELPAGEAFETARTVAAQSGQPVVLVDPKTREVVGIAGKSASAR